MSLMVATVVCVVVGRVAGSGPDWVDLPPTAFVLAVPAFFAVLWLTRPPRSCTYVGTEGFASARLILGFIQGSATPRRFADVTSIRSTFTRVFKRGYAGTAFAYDWLDAEGRKRFSIKGAFHEYEIGESDLDENATRSLPIDHPLHFARAAEAAWEHFRASRGRTLQHREQV